MDKYNFHVAPCPGNLSNVVRSGAPSRMSPPVRPILAALIAAILPAMLIVSAQTSHASSASWLPSPPTSNWNDAANWTVGGPPNGPSDTATFSSSSQTGISLSPNIQVNSIVFNAGASAYTITITA